MNCYYCKSELKEGTTALTFQMSEGRVIVVKDVPALICKQCGEESINLENSKVVERLVKKAIADGITMGFIQYNNAA